jgi:hypothetical protein
VSSLTPSSDKGQASRGFDTPAADNKGRLMNPSARVTVTSQSKSVARLRLYGYGEDPRVANEGDLLIVSETALEDAGVGSTTEFEITVRGKDMKHLAAKVNAALELYNENADYLSQPASRVMSSAERAIGILDAGRLSALHKNPVNIVDPSLNTQDAVRQASA